jgi:hypothetical protein
MQGILDNREASEDAHRYERQGQGPGKAENNAAFDFIQRHGRVPGIPDN